MCLKCRWAAESSGRNLCYLIVGDNECCAPDTSLDTPHWSESLMSLLMTNNNNNTASGQCRDSGHCQEEVIISVSVVSIWCFQVLLSCLHTVSVIITGQHRVSMTNDRLININQLSQLFEGMTPFNVWKLDCEGNVPVLKTYKPNLSKW